MNVDRRGAWFMAKLNKVATAVSAVFGDRAYLYVVGSATYKTNPRDLDLLVVVKRPRGGALARFYRLAEAIGGVKIGANYCSADRLIGEWDTWVGLIDVERLGETPPVLLRTWRENYIAIRGPPLDALIPPVRITLEDVVYGMYGVKYCEDVLTNNRAYEAVLEGDSFVRRKVVLSEEQRRFFVDYCRKWIRRNLAAVGELQSGVLQNLSTTQLPRVI